MVRDSIKLQQVFQSRYVNNLYVVVVKEPHQQPTTAIDYKRISLNDTFTNVIDYTRVGIINGKFCYDSRPTTVGEEYFRAQYNPVEDPEILKAIKMVLL